MTKDHGSDIEAADVLRMFPSFVWKAELKPYVHKMINGNVLTKLEQLRETLPELATQLSEAIQLLGPRSCRVKHDPLAGVNDQGKPFDRSCFTGV